MSGEFHREYLLRLPLPLAQLYSRAYNAKDARGRHDNTFYLFEALIKLAAIGPIACYLQEVEHGAPRAVALDRLLAQLALPSLGQWVAMLRGLTRHFGERAGAPSHPLGHTWNQLNEPHRDRPALLALYRRIKNGPDGEPAGDQCCSLMQVLDALVQYRNGVFGHGAGRFESFYEKEIGPLLLPAAGEMLAEGVFDLLGPRGSRLVYLTELRTVDENRVEVALTELVGREPERMSPLELTSADVAGLVPNCVAVLWPGRRQPLRLDPLLVFRSNELAEEVRFLNRERNGRHVEYLSYSTGRTERDKAMGPQMARLLSRVTGRDVSEEDLARLGEQSLAETPSLDALLEAKPVARQMGDYEILAEIGRGGMGVVYLAVQLSLGRLVALKMLPSDLAGNEVALARLRGEIRHLAQCEHPNIVKVLSSGTMPDGQLYYAMEYVPGADLELVWRELTGPDATADSSSPNSTNWTRAVLNAGRKNRDQTTKRAASHRSETSPVGREPTDPTTTGHVPDATPAWQNLAPPQPQADDDLTGYIRRVTALIRDAALALQAVHEQKLIHRDIKPANLMLTPDGSRVVLMDFGLAKGQSLTGLTNQQAGFLGTLRYAAPEQLATKLLETGPAADVRALGGVFWELLTRKRLYGEAQDETQLTMKVLGEDVPRLRSVDASFDKDLEAIVARATERRVADRIPTAARLADYLQLYLEGKPLPIRPPTASEMVWRWVRDHKSLVGSSAAAALAVLATVIVALVLIMQSKNRAEKLAGENLQLAQEEQHQREMADARAEEARRARDAAQRYGEMALETLTTVVFNIQKKLEGIPAARSVRRSLLMTALSRLEQLGASLADDSRVDRNLEAVHNDLGNLFLMVGHEEGLGGVEQALAQYELAHRIAAQLAAVKPEDAQSQRDLLVSHNKIGNASLQLGRVDAALKSYQQGLEIGRRLAEADPRDAEVQRDLSISYGNVGNLSLQLGQAEAALKSYQQGLEIGRRLAEADPHDATTQRDLSISYGNLGNARLQLGQTEAALQSYQQGLEIGRRLAEADLRNVQAQRDLSIWYDKLGDVSLQLGQADAALKFYQQGLEIGRQLAEADPQNVTVQRDLSVSYNKLGDVSLQLGQADAAHESYEQGLKIGRRLAEADPHKVTAQRDLSVSYNKLGDANLQLGQVDTALKFYQQGLEIRERLAEADPHDAQAQRDLWLSYFKVGSGEEQRYEFAQAEPHYERALELARSLSANGQFSGAAAQMTALAEQSLAECKKREKVVADLDFALAQRPDEVAGLLAVRALALAAHGETSGASVAAEKLMGLPSKKPEDVYAAARAYGSCAAAITQGKTEFSPSERAEQQKFRDRALRTLRAAIAAGFHDFKQMAQSPDLRALRELPEFQQILASESR